MNLSWSHNTMDILTEINEVTLCESVVEGIDMPEKCMLKRMVTACLK